MRKYGYKFFSADIKKSFEKIQGCIDFIKSKTDVFVELMLTPDTSQSDLMNLKSHMENIEVRIHVPHNIMGFDVGNKNLEETNKEIFSLCQKAADIFNSKTMVVHAGCGRGQQFLQETARQIKLLDDKRIVVENLPLEACDSAPLCGNIAEEIKYIMQETGCGFCFDFSHAILAAQALHLDIEKQLKSFFDLKPTVYHLCDGDMSITRDLHLHFGEGNYPLKHFVNDLTDENAYITMETGKGIIHGVDALVKDYETIKSLVV